MKIDELKPFYNKVFRLEELENYFDEPVSTVKGQLSRLVKNNILLRLKKNCYTFPDSHPDPMVIAQKMVAPSYHSLEFVLSQSGIIPEGTSAYTMITSQKTQSYKNGLGTFSYRHLPPNLFFGVEQRADGAWIALPEKALLDYLYLNSSKFKPDFACFQAERFDELDKLDWKKMKNWAKKYGMQKLVKLVESLESYAKSEDYQAHL